MRHRQTTGAGPSGARPGITILFLTAVGGGLAAGLNQPAGAWAGYGTVSIAALVGFGTLWQQQGLLERRAKEMARRRRADLAESASAEQSQRAEVERVRAELEHEQQYSALIQGQLARAREQLDQERAGRRAAERELDALTGAGTGKGSVIARWKPGAPSALLTVEEPDAERASVAEAEDLAVGEEAETSAQPSATRALTGMSAAQRRGWQVVDGEGGGEDEDAAETDRIYRPFLDQLSAAVVPVSDAALAMAPVIGAADLDGVLDLTAYDETVEFSLRELNKGTA
jgi:hypothetical protein